MEEYISEITKDVLTLIKQNTVLTDESSLAANEYFVLLFYVSYSSYFRNYKEYKGNYLYTDSRYYLEPNKQGPEHGYYISKHFNKVKNTNKGLVLKVRVNDSSQCVSLDE
jgi:hypothetical protein